VGAAFSFKEANARAAALNEAGLGGIVALSRHKYDVEKCSAERPLFLFPNSLI
jgi:hypothetical protein